MKGSAKLVSLFVNRVVRVSATRDSYKNETLNVREVPGTTLVLAESGLLDGGREALPSRLSSWREGGSPPWLLVLSSFWRVGT